MLCQIHRISGKAKDIDVSRGDVHSMIFRVEQKDKLPRPCTSSLVLQWRRKERMPLQQISSSLLEEGKAREVIENGETSTAETACRLHDLVTQKPLLSVCCQPPSVVETGVAFAYSVSVRNETTLPEEFEITMSESPGCLFCGDRTQQLMIAPLGQRQLKWECITYASGNVKVPKIMISAPRLQCFVEAGGMEIFVRPRPLT